VRPSRSTIPVFLGVAAVALPGCGGQDEVATVTLPATNRYKGIERPRYSAAPGDYESVKQIVDRYGDRLWDRWDGVTGFGVGSSLNHPAPTRAHVYVITVLLESAKDLPNRRQSFKGVPIEFRVSGPIVAQ
jgi:hypothetical protein